jgi:hypothetical protein
LIFNPEIDSKFPGTGDRHIVLSALDTGGNQILPTGFATQQKFYALSQLFNEFEEGKKASLSSINELDFKIKRLHFNNLFGESRIVKAISDRASDFDPTTGILEFGQAVLPGEVFGFSFEIDTLGEFAGEGIIMISVLADTGAVSSAINESENLLMSGIVISPNPAYDNIKLIIQDNKSDMLNVIIYDAMGRIIFDIKGQSEAELSSGGIDISHLHSGIYNVLVKSSTLTKIAKFIKIK